MNIKGITNRMWMSSAAVLAIAVVVGLLLSFISMANGFKKTLEQGGSEQMLIIMRQGSQSETNSTISAEQVNILKSVPGLEINTAGDIMASAELYVIVDGIKKTTGSKTNLPLRGLSPQGIAIRQNIQITQGRMFNSGKNEIIVGEGILSQFSGFELGKSIVFGKTKWTVVGVFSSGGSAFEGELWTDIRDVQSQFQRANTYQSLRLLLNNSNQLDVVKKIVKQDARLNVDVKTEKQYLAEQGEAMRSIVIIGWILGIAMALGALAGALNTMYSSVAARSKEIATLRAIGFSGFATFLGTLIESLVLAMLGGLIGCIATYFMFDGLTTSTLGRNFTQVVFSFKLSFSAVIDALILSIIVGFLGGFFPAWRAAKLPVVKAFRE